MKRRFSAPVFLVTIAALLLVDSCVKNVPPGLFFNPLIGGCQVAELHDPSFDGFFKTPPPYLFRKTFDPSGKIVKEIAYSFNDDIVPSELPVLTGDLLIEQKGWIVYLIKKDSIKTDPPDTMARIYFNRLGRPDSCVGKSGIDINVGVPETEYYYYKDNRLLAVRNDLHFGEGSAVTNEDTIHYDKFGNPLSFAGNVYQYDYRRKAKQQFYSNDFMGGYCEYYLLQYLGFFPEITSPPNLRIQAQNADVGEGTSLTNHQFDAEGRLIGYDSNDGHISITWNCQ